MFTEENIKKYNLPNDVILNETGVDIIYIGKNPEICSELELQKVIYFCSQMGVEFAGEGNLRKLQKSFNGIDVKKLLKFTMTDFQKSIGANGLKLYTSLKAKMQKVQPQLFMDAVNAFGRGIGERKLQMIVDVYETIDVTEEQMQHVAGWSDITIYAHTEGMKNYHEWMNWLKDNNMEIKYKKLVKQSSKYDQVKVVFTGVRSAELEDIIRMNGGKILSSATKECNLVIAKDPNSGSGKAQKARDMGIEIISLTDAYERFK